MAFTGVYTSGSVAQFAGASGLLQTAVTFLTSDGGTPGKDWTQQYMRNTRDATNVDEPFGSTCKECILTNTGLTGSETVIVGIREWQYTTEGAYAWDINCYTYYNADMAWNANQTEHGRTGYDATWEHWTQLPVVPFTNGTLYYWIFSNSQRFVIITKVSSNYETCYLGFGRRFGSPNDYPYPCVALGSGYGNIKYSTQTDVRQYIVNNYGTNDYGRLVIDPGGGYVAVDDIEMAPRFYFDATGGTVGPTLTLNRHLLTPAYVNDVGAGQCYMDLDGVMHVTSSGVQSEDRINSGLKYFVFQNCHRTNYYDFACVAQATTTTSSTSSSSTTTTTSTSSSTVSTTTTTTSTSSSSTTTTSSSSSSTTTTSSSSSSSTTTTSTTTAP